MTGCVIMIGNNMNAWFSPHSKSSEFLTGGEYQIFVLWHNCVTVL